ncbi:response regulator transcription factor [Actinoplanes sp. NPDC049599]|uniref:response regulator transcription factor n=1 Tax=Actinoplanes sp. NPDC049599 TaxID=3363903 RepID=UPI003795C924
MGDPRRRRSAGATLPRPRNSPANAPLAAIRATSRSEGGGPGRRPREVLGPISRGLSNGGTAGRRHLAEGTVKTHVSRVPTRLGLRDRVQAVVHAYECGLIRAGAPTADRGLCRSAKISGRAVPS